MPLHSSLPREVEKPTVPDIPTVAEAPTSKTGILKPAVNEALRVALNESSYEVEAHIWRSWALDCADDFVSLSELVVPPDAVYP
jgi:hypothetical protein